MKYRQLFFLLVIFGVVACSAPKYEYNIDSVASPRGTEVYQPDWDSIAQHYHFPEWFTDGKFGIFIHWGVYSVPAYNSEWYPRDMYLKDSRVYKHHIETWGQHTEFGYKDFIPLFKAERFDADEWADLFKEAGAMYVVPVAEHHDGFAMYDSDLNPWNSVKMGPKKDFIASLKKAIEEREMVFGLSSHRAENAWFFNGGMGFPSDVQDSTNTLYGRRYANEVYTEDFAREWLVHTYELITKYEPKLIWFDWTVGNPMLQPYFNRFLAYYYNNALDWGTGVVVNTKSGYPANIQVCDVERGKLGTMMRYPWQTDTAVGTKSWCYIDDEVYKTPGQIVHELVDIVSKNGNLLLNVGPKADGTIPQEQKDILLAIGGWLKVNGEAIYGTHCWKKHGEGETESAAGAFTDNKEIPYTANDIRFTTKGSDFYAIVLNWSDRGILIKSLTPEIIGDAKIQNITMLGTDEKIEWTQTDEGLNLSFPVQKPCEYAYTFKISFDKLPGESLESEAVEEMKSKTN
ncbi:alpha-L-fucosidase [Bacteroides uniformis]|uniref:alpha-L-fucosidase n=1 Tax=Bacteroides uniformis TaxID=820 RepID=UPI0018972E60|nr:alpha-L-fucosidase [Bacteroides uniformis]